jgi:AcrR family transcriptional regulator
MVGVTTFQRARSQEAREVRRQAILDTAARMLDEMPTNLITLNELSRRSHLAKSAILKYFESREAILLELLDRAWARWTAELGERLADQIDADQTAHARGAQLSAVLTKSLEPHPQLCELLSAQAGVLEHNVSAEVAGRYKKAAFANVTALTGLIRQHLPETGDIADRLAPQIIMAIGAVWTHSRPSPGMLAAYEADPRLADMRLEFTPSLLDMVDTLVSGTLTRSSASR